MKMRLGSTLPVTARHIWARRPPPCGRPRDAARLTTLSAPPLNTAAISAFGMSAEARYVEREEHLPAHRIHVGHRVWSRRWRRRVGIVHDGRKEVHRADDRDLIGDAVDGGVVAMREPDRRSACSCRVRPPNTSWRSQDHPWTLSRRRPVARQPDLLARLPGPSSGNSMSFPCRFDEPEDPERFQPAQADSDSRRSGKPRPR